VRVAVALGGNALLRRGEALTDENQRRNVAVACESLAPLALEHELVVSHGNAPQVGLLALHGAGRWSTSGRWSGARSGLS
jgi:carbamate kinase